MILSGKLEYFSAFFEKYFARNIAASPSIVKQTLSVCRRAKIVFPNDHFVMQIRIGVKCRAQTHAPSPSTVRTPPGPACKLRMCAGLKTASDLASGPVKPADPMKQSTRFFIGSRRNRQSETAERRMMMSPPPRSLLGGR